MTEEGITGEEALMKNMSGLMSQLMGSGGLAGLMGEKKISE